MSEMLGHQPGELEIYPEVEVPETEIHKISDIESFEKEGYIPDEEFSRIVQMVCSEIGKIFNSGKRLSYEKVEEAKDKFLKGIDSPNEKLLADEKLYQRSIKTSIRIKLN